MGSISGGRLGDVPRCLTSLAVVKSRISHDESGNGRPTENSRSGDVCRFTKFIRSHKLTSGGERSVWIVLSSTGSLVASVDGTFNKKSKYRRFQKFDPPRNIVAKCFMRTRSATTQKFLTPLVKFVPLDA